jgi:hypothetical protein
LTILFALGLALWFDPGQCPALVGDTEGIFGLDGNVRTNGALVNNYDFPPFFGEDNEIDQLLQTILRLTAGGRPSDRLAYEIHLAQSLTYFSAGAAGSGAFELEAGKKRYRALDEEWQWLSEDKVTATLGLDRFNLKIALPRADITVGRQAITFGKAYFWNPLDVYAPFDPAQFDRDYKAGVDALRLDVPMGSFSGFTLVGVLGRELDSTGNYVSGDGTWDACWYGSSVLARFFTNFKGWDLAFQGGKIYGGYQLGGGLVGEIDVIAVRAEAAYFWADETLPLPSPLEGDLIEDNFVGVLGLGHRFENTLSLELEYLYNGAGDDDDLTSAFVRFQGGITLHMGQHLTGLLVSYDLLPILVGQLAFIYSLSDSSFLLQPLLNLSLTDDADLILGATINSGQRPEGDLIQGIEIKSEFGTFPDLYFFQVKYYF